MIETTAVAATAAFAGGALLSQTVIVLDHVDSCEGKIISQLRHAVGGKSHRFQRGAGECAMRDSYSGTDAFDPEFRAGKFFEKFDGCLNVIEGNVGLK